MAHIVSTPGASNANSFLSLARAEELADEHPFAAPWNAVATSEAKESLLILASRLVNYRVCYDGTKATSTQSLKFPMVGLTSNGYAIDSTTIPLEIELATFELANMLASSNISVESSASVEGLTKLKVGSVELNFRDATIFQSLPANVLSYIPASWLCPVDPKVAEFQAY